MPIYYDVKAAIINESSTHIERLAARIIQLSDKVQDEFIKTFPFMSYPRNKATFARYGEDFYSPTKLHHLGISFVSYGYANYIKFASSFKSFPLKVGDRVEFYFEDETHMEFTFAGNGTKTGILDVNVHLIADRDLAFIAANNLKYWKLYNQEHEISLVGGFVQQEMNKQYQSERVGQKIFRLMAENILTAKAYIAAGIR